MRRLILSSPVMMIMLVTILAFNPFQNCFAEDMASGIGIQQGAFMIYPQLKAGMTYNDNIYATDTNTKSDWIATIAPNVLASSTWSRHALKLDAGMDTGFYMDESDEDYYNAHVLANGRVDVVQDSYFDLKAGYENIYEDRGSPDSLASWSDPGRYEVLSAGAWANQDMGRFFLKTGGNLANYNYHSVDMVGGGSDTQESRDRNEYDVDARVGYEWLPNVNPFMEARYNWRQYNKDELALRDSNGYRIGAGTGIYMGGITSCEVFGGYMSQDYDDREREDVSSAWYGLTLLWDATQLTSVKAGVKRDVKETTLAGASGIIGTDVDFRVSHELLRNVKVGLDLGYTYDNYEGVNVNDKYYRVGPNVSYQLNRYLSADLGYEFRQRDSSQNERLRNYDTNMVMCSITGRL
ncbi:MAG: outer membrane beta-barrel protein [Desulfosalsimonadaceae bacterium]|nr:outer membrane beta-barrel protein [Desulfosalsimonadaceae bacterium]